MKGQVLHERVKEFGQQNHEGESKKIQFCMLKNRKSGRKKLEIVLEEYESESSWHPAVQSFCRCHQTKLQGAQLEAAATCSDPEVYLYHLLQKYQSRGARQTPGDVHTEKSLGRGKKLQQGKRDLSKMNSWCCQREQSIWGGPSAGPGAGSLCFREHPEQPCSQVAPPPPFSHWSVWQVAWFSS